MGGTGVLRVTSYVLLRYEDLNGSLRLFRDVLSSTSESPLVDEPVAMLISGCADRFLPITLCARSAIPTWGSMLSNWGGFLFALPDATVVFCYEKGVFWVLLAEE